MFSVSMYLADVSTQTHPACSKASWSGCGHPGRPPRCSRTPPVLGSQASSERTRGRHGVRHLQDLQSPLTSWTFDVVVSRRPLAGVGVDRTPPRCGATARRRPQRRPRCRERRAAGPSPRSSAPCGAKPPSRCAPGEPFDGGNPPEEEPASVECSSNLGVHLANGGSDGVTFEGFFVVTLEVPDAEAAVDDQAVEARIGPRPDRRPATTPGVAASGSRQPSR
jgi:hypothetical protein